MRRSLRITAITIILLLVVALGLNIVFASPGAEPGSSQDPIISKSYVDAAVSQLTAGMQKLQEQVDALKNENTQLTTKLAAQEQSNKLLLDQINALKKDIAAGTIKNSGSIGSASNSGNTGGTVGTGTKPPVSIGKATVNTVILNIRKAANTDSIIVAKAAMGDTLTLVAKSGDWYKVTTSKGITGYVMTKLILIKK